MNTKMMLVIAALAAGGYYGHQAWREKQAFVPPDAHGFVPVAMPDGASTNTVIIFAPLNCPSDAAQRADGLAAELTRRGVPNMRLNSAQFSGGEPSAIQRTLGVMNGQIPAVIVNGMGRSNPTFEQVVAEYRQTRAARRAGPQESP